MKVSAKLGFLSLFLVCALLSGVSHAGEDAPSGLSGYRAELGVGRAAGDIAYEIRFLSEGVENRSKLTFPVDVALARGAAALSFPVDGLRVLEVGMGFSVSLDDPQGAMLDEDWYSGYLVGYTESELLLEMWTLDVFGRVWRDERPLRTGSYRWWWGSSYTYERYDAEVYGAEGYYLPPLGDGVVAVDPSVLALTYEMEAHALMFGVGIKGACRRFCVSGSAELGGVYMQDYDIHRLRGFYAEAVAGGGAVRLRGEGRIWLDSGPQPHWYLNAEISYFGARAWGEQTQYHLNQTYGGIEDTLTIDRSTVTAGVGCEF